METAARQRKLRQAAAIETFSRGVVFFVSRRPEFGIVSRRFCPAACVRGRRRNFKDARGAKCAGPKSISYGAARINIPTLRPESERAQLVVVGG